MKTTFSQQSADYQRIERAIRFLEANFRQHPSLEEIAASIHLTKYHFQRLFKRWAGISPSQFLQYLTIEYAKQRLRESQSILDATLAAGLSSPGRLHDLFVTFEALTPGEYKRQGAGLEITLGGHDTPFGRCLLATTARGICGLHFVHETDVETVVESLVDHWPLASFVEDPGKTQPLIDHIFQPVPQDLPRPFHLLLRGTNFQVNVWQALLEIPPGALVSYQDVAAYLGKPQAARSVAGAIARNPIAYLIPCHRVISKTGKSHHYRWGTVRKKAMLGWEASRRDQTMQLPPRSQQASEVV
jgi:AraC family transcriptional regulator of adaptative response/methylated-DNA-[protein]-cysteine methyltransferase